MNRKSQNYEKESLSHLYFFKRTSRNFYNSLMKSLILSIKYYKKFHNFFTSLERGNRKKKDVENVKK